MSASGKPASVAASRAGAPRVLVYVGDPRQLEPGAAAAGPEPPAAAPATPPPPPPDALYLHHNSHHHLPVHRNTIYRTQIEQTDQRHPSNTIFYKSLNDNDSKVSAYGAADNTVVQRTEFFPVSQQFLKEPCIKVEDKNVIERPGSVKRDCANLLGTELSSIETFRIPIDSGEIATYRSRCQTQVIDNIMPSMQPVPIRHSQNQFDSCSVQSGETTNCSDRELSVGKSYVNYQFLEQSVSHQSIVNQSISILNQQVGVNRGVVEGDSGNAPQLVRTADGVVLAVLPSSVLPHPTETSDLTSRTAQSDSPQTVTVPLGWRRIVTGTSALYISPSGTALSTLPQLRDYLQTAGTCKCGLPCPLRPETAFSFDPKVVSKPYQAASGAELTKLCNHKRKLLATLQARAQSPATPPPHHMEQKKVPSAEVGVLKKKMKKRPGFPHNMNVSQLMTQRERPLNDYKPQDIEHHSTISPGMGVRPNNGQQSMPTYTPVQHIPNAISQDTDVKQETHVQKSSHYLTVSSGWITQQDSIDMQKYNQSSGPANTSLGVGLPVLGTNGQIIGVNTGYNKPTNFKNNMSVMSHSVIEHDHKEDKDMLTPQQLQQVKHSVNKEEESQIFCGLNQPLTPEVMQKINEQQQIFIQQNQKQIEMAMKGFRTQLADNVPPKSQGQSQYVPQAQLVIQNGAVVKTNPAKTPPWQVKRNDSNTSVMTSPGPKAHKLDSIDYEESNANISEDSSGSFSPYPNNDQAMCSRVPPLPQHYNMMGQQWPGVDVSKKKMKTNNKGGRKKANPTEKLITYGGNGMRILQDSKGSACDDMPNNNVPSFMDDPSGYLAQQTVLLNNTISRQVGINSSFDGNQYERPGNCYGSQNHSEKPVKSMAKPCDVPNIYRNNMVPNPSSSPNNTPDSSVLSDKSMDHSIPHCCKGCNVSMKSNSDLTENQMRLKYMKSNMYKLELDGNPATSSPRHVFDDNPVTSSTFIDRSPLANDNCGPIQAGTVSTSNVSPPETLQPPEPSPTLSNSSRSTDTPHSSGSNSSQLPTNCTFPIQSPAYSSPGSCIFNSNLSTPGGGQIYPYSSSGPPNNQSITGTQMMHFISNHNVNKNLMEVDNISMVGVKPVLKTQHEMYRSEPRKRVENSMPGYCPPPHLGGGPAHSLIQACYVQTFVTTMASGFSVTRDTVTSVLAGKANTATTSINAAQANFIRPPPPPSVNLATSYAIPNNQPDPFLNSVNLPTSYPLHIAGTTAQNMISKSPLEMVQNVIGSIPSKGEASNVQPSTISMSGRRAGATPGQILISSTGQIIVSNNQMPPPPPKTTTAVSPLHGSSPTTNVTTSLTQVVGGVQPMMNQSTVVVNTLQTPFVIQPPMMAVDGQVMQQNTVLPQIVTGVVSGQSPNERDGKNGQGFIQGVAMLSPESLKKRTKKKKGQTANLTNVLQITAPQQNPNNIMVHSSPQHNTSSQFSPRGFQLSPNNNISPTPMLQALTIMPGKSGTPAHIVMNGQGNTNNFGSQQIITNTSPSQQINLLQPVNLINNGSGVVPNFPAFQQFIVPNLGGMVMTADGATIIQDNSSGMPMQLQLQTVNGQNVLTPVQNSGVFTTGANGGVVIRAQNQQGKIIQSQHSPGAQFLSPNSQVMMNSPNFNGQLSPLLANLSPTNVTFNTSPHQVRSGNVQAQEFIQTNQMGQTLMVPLSPKQASLASATNNRSNSTFVQQNTTIVQQQTTLVANSHNTQMSSISSNIQGGNSARLSIDPNVLLAKQMPHQKRFLEMPAEQNQRDDKDDKHENVVFNQLLNENDKLEFISDFGGMLGQGGLSGHVRHSVSTQTLVNQQRGKSPSSQAVSGTSPPDTTTHSPLGALEPSASPRVYGARCLSTQGNYADTTTKSPEPADINSSGMVQCVSSSEQDMAESREHTWRAPRSDFSADTDAQNVMANIPLMRQNRTPSSAETTEMHYNQSMSTAPVNNQHIMPVSSNYYDRAQAYKRKNDFGDGSSYRTDKIMRSNNGMVHGLPKDTDYNTMGMNSQDKSQARHYQSSGSSSDATARQKVFDRHNLGSSDDMKSDDESDKSQDMASESKFEVGDLVWGPVKGYASWPGKLEGRTGEERWIVRWFGGDKAPGCVDDSRLLTLTEGLEAHHAARTKHRKSRKLNTLLENAIQEAMAELDKKSEKMNTEIDGTGEDAIDDEPITETPRRSKKHEKVRKDKHHKKNTTKITFSLNKSGDGTRLRSAR